VRNEIIKVIGIESKERNYDGDGNREWGTKLWWW
jgi:hypothetical protein